MVGTLAWPMGPQMPGGAVDLLFWPVLAFPTHPGRPGRTGFLRTRRLPNENAAAVGCLP
jgi:hypothetical protein